MDGKSQAWRDAADQLLLALAKENKYIVADMLIIFLESANYGLNDYSTLGGVFKRGAKKGIISRIQRPTKQALWVSQIYNKPEMEI
jgi:phage terminase large subunit